MPLLPKQSSRKLEPSFVPSLLVRLLFISIDILYGFTWNAVGTPRLLLQVAVWICLVSYFNGCIGILVLLLLLLLNSWLIVEMLVAQFSWLRFYFGRCLSELAELGTFWWRCTLYSDVLHDFSVAIPKCYKDIYINSVFPHTARLCYLPAKCFPLTFDLNDFNCVYAFHLCLLVFLLNPFRSSLSQMFFKVSVLKNFAVFTGKHLWLSLFNKVASIIKKGLHCRCFLVNITKLSRTLFLQTPLVAAYVH